MGIRMKKAILILLAAAAAWAQGADPYVGYIYPCGLQVGTTNRLVVGGQFMWGVRTGTVLAPITSRPLMPMRRTAIFVVRPPKSLNISISNKPEEIQRVYDIGRDMGEKYVDKIKEFLDE